MIAAGPTTPCEEQVLLLQAEICYLHGIIGELQEENHRLAEIAKKVAIREVLRN
eukprot:m.325706 g.325706  ORF g.325706 m.325706 type:complete len:54 (-) comp55564_c2_seq14:986-1147(-)